MSWSLSVPLSRLLLRYYFGKDHRAKIRLWAWVHRLLGFPRFKVGYAGGKCVLSLDMRDFIQFEVLKTGGYEPEVWTRLKAVATEKEVVWDVGANIGSFGFLAATDACVREVHCFEPNPKVAVQLQRNRRLNPHLALVVHPFALGAHDAQRIFYTGLKANTGVAGFYPHWAAEPVQVKSVRGDRLVQEGVPVPTLIKIDVEGAEGDVLKGLESVLKKTPPKAIIFEAHWGPHGTLSSQSVVDYLAAMGYQCELPPPGGEGQPFNLLARLR